MEFDQIKEIAKSTPSKIVLMVMDGLGGLPHPDTGKTELETAKTPNIDLLAREGMCGLIDTVSPGITPGSAPGHLALFGYNPLKFKVGRGVLEALGIDFDLKAGDVAARGNFCTVDQRGLVTDRRAGRISTETNIELCKLLDGFKSDNVSVIVSPVKEHRFVVVLRGEGLSSELSDSDPQVTGVAPKEVAALLPQAARAAHVATRFVAKAKTVLADKHPANMVLLRGFDQYPNFPKMGEVFKLNPAAISSYPMYRGLAKVVGMQVLATGAAIEDEFATLTQNFADHDFFFLHIKQTDSAGEDGDFERKVKVIESVDCCLPRLLALKPDVIVVTGDHSTPALLKAHSWHPLPMLLHSRWCRPDRVEKFSERACAAGSLGKFHATHIMPLALAHALKLEKFGA